MTRHSFKYVTCVQLICLFVFAVNICLGLTVNLRTNFIGLIFVIMCFSDDND